MICLCCGKDIKEETERLWHTSCARSFFGSSDLPELELSTEALLELANASVSKGKTVPGVQKKLSLNLVLEKKPRLTVVDYLAGYILKPPTSDYPALPELEFLTMKMAEVVKIATVPAGLLKSKEGTYSYITKRIDRKINYRTHEEEKYAMEDFCQLGNRLTEDKYNGSYEKCAKIIDRYSSTDHLDLTELFIRLVFCYIVGNSDMHLKNFSLIETEPASGIYKLSPAYDLLPVNLVLPEDTEVTALTLNGKKKNLRRSDFKTFANTINLNEKVADRLIDRILSFLPKMESTLDNPLLPEDLQQSFKKLIHERADRIR